MTLVPRTRTEKCQEGGILYSIGVVLLKERRNRDFRLRGKLPGSVTRELGSRTENLIQQQAGQKTQKNKYTKKDNITEYDALCMFHTRPLRNIYTYAVNQEMRNDKICVIIN